MKVKHCKNFDRILVSLWNLQLIKLNNVYGYLVKRFCIKSTIDY